MSSPAPSQQKPVIIIGGGLAGLACAVTLHQHGVPFQLHEKDGRTGGVVKTDAQNGFLLDHGFQVYLTAYPAGQHFFGNHMPLAKFKSGALVYQNSRFYPLMDPLRHPFTLLSTLFSPVGSLKDKILVGVLRLQNSGKPIHKIFAEPEGPTSDRLKHMGFSQGFIQAFFNPFLGGVFLDEHLETSSRMANFVLSMFSKGEAALPLKGMGELPNTLLKQLPAQSIRLNSPVKSIINQQVHLQNGETLEGSAIVIATNGFNSASMEFTKPQGDYRSVICMYFSAPESPLSEPILVLNGTNEGPINNLVVPSDVSPHYAPSGKALISVSIIKKDYMSFTEEDLYHAVTRQLSSWFGKQLNEWEHLKTYRITHALPAFNTGDNSANTPYTTLQPNIYQCGDFTSSPSIQGALDSGQKAAEAICKTLKQS